MTALWANAQQPDGLYPQGPDDSAPCDPQAVGDVDWSKWQRATRGAVGWQRIPPASCPHCHMPWARDGAARPLERFVTCGCTTSRHHTAWRCRSCDALAAEGCVDVSRWSPSTVGLSIAADRRYGLGQ